MTDAERRLSPPCGALNSRFAVLSDAELDAAFEKAFGGCVTPAELEKFFGWAGPGPDRYGTTIGRWRSNTLAPIHQVALEPLAERGCGRLKVSQPQPIPLLAYFGRVQAVRQQHERHHPIHRGVRGYAV
jgi:hypothetical protein